MLDRDQSRGTKRKNQNHIARKSQNGKVRGHDQGHRGKKSTKNHQPPLRRHITEVIGKKIVRKILNKSLDRMLEANKLINYKKCTVTLGKNNNNS